ncbi:SusC/RagA family TonB-linked outer membrane protein [Echinicola marina]|uniref:SusC/RagA family TonB-linked outer membrane protein n=1 Tax=Echinicola marina TaxID=2859768 RepID=UPI001CF67E29|nr:SusC/RagA family TonB-linked outer membrane protein [Echinicola marina]UCS93153.1 SusC/RagA family TonB-linked outer membrane protein [Echinicola marina]
MEKILTRTSLFVFIYLLVFQVMAQGIMITGKVTTQKDGSPLPGVSVLLQGTTSGSVTDLDGMYSIDVSEGEGNLVFSYLGFVSQTIAINNRTEIDVVMAEDVSQLGEVVVTALGITRDERSIGYATQEVDGENLTFTKEQNVLGSLSGKIAGVQVEGASGASMGGTQKIKIRGVNSISGGSQPLIVVDGTPISNSNFSGSSGVDYGNLGQDVNPEDIASINVLKGPAASALYGIRGQYGVVMITTKKGQEDSKVKVELSSAVFVESVYNLMPYQNLYGGGSSQTWRTLPNGDKYVDIAVDESWGPLMDGTMVRHVESFYPQDPEYGQLAPFVPHPDNIKDYYETGTNVNNGVTITGGGKNSNYRISLNDTRVQGVEPNTMLKRNNVGVSVGTDLTEKLRVSTNINYAANRGRRPGQGSEDGSRYMGQWFQRSLDMERLKNYKYDDGSFFHWNLRRPSTSTGEVTNFSPLYWANPYFLAYENFSNDSRDRLFGDVGLTYQVLPELKLSGFVRSDMYTQNIDSRAAFGGRGNPGYSVGKYQNKEMNYEFLAQYTKAWDKFSLDANFGTNFYDRDYSYLSMATVGGLSSPGFYNIDASIDRPATNSYKLRKQIKSIYGMVSLGYNNIYFLDASIRNDNTSTLPKGNNSYWYPSLSGSFVFSELMEWKPLSLGKLRLSYAQAGSDLSPYGTTSFYNVGSIYSGSSTVNTLAVPDNLNNPNVEPSFAHSYEAGLDLKFFEGKLGLAFTYYQQINKNQILSLDVSGASGYGSATINAGQIENKGFELAITASPLQQSKLNWDIAFNISRNRNEVVELYPGIDVYQYGSTTYSSTSSYLNSYVGKPFGSLVGQAYQRDEATGKILLDGNNLPLYTDATHDFGTVLPDFNGGLQNVFSYGNFDLAAMVDFQIGGQFFSRSKMLAVRTGLDPISAEINDKGFNVRDDVADGGGVRVEGISAETGEDVVAYVNPRSYYGVVARRIYEDWLYDASYVRLKEVRLGYNFTKNKLGNLPVENVRVALVGRNLAMIFQNAPKGINPAEISTGSQSIGWYESGQLPSVRSVGFNLNVTF